MKKKWFALLVSMVVTLSAFVLPVRAAAAWEMPLIQLLAESPEGIAHLNGGWYSYQADWNSSRVVRGYELYDFNGDGVPEAVLYCCLPGSDGRWTEMYYFINGKYERHKSFEGDLFGANDKGEVLLKSTDYEGSLTYYGVLKFVNGQPQVEDLYRAYHFVNDKNMGELNNTGRKLTFMVKLGDGKIVPLSNENDASWGSVFEPTIEAGFDKPIVSPIYKDPLDTLVSQYFNTKKIDRTKLEPTIIMSVDASNMMVGGKMQPIDSQNTLVKPNIKNGRTMVPVRCIAESLGATVTYKNGMVTIVKDKKTIVMPIGTTEDVTINGFPVYDLDVAAEAIQGRAFVPLRFIAESLAKGVAYKDGVIYIVSDIYKPDFSDTAQLASQLKAK